MITVVSSKNPNRTNVVLNKANKTNLSFSGNNLAEELAVLKQEAAKYGIGVSGCESFAEVRAAIEHAKALKKENPFLRFCADFFEGFLEEVANVATYRNH